jgi:hypothetical protein
MAINIITAGGGGGVSAADLNPVDAGMEFTGGFADRGAGAVFGERSIAHDVEYTQTMVDNRTWYRFGFDATNQAAFDSAYWSSPAPSPTAGVGLFGGDHMPGGVTSMFDFTANDVAYNQATALGSEVPSTTAATGSFDFTEATPGDLAKIRFDLNLTPSADHTTFELALIWATRDGDDNITFTFPLTGTPFTLGSGTAGETFPMRAEISAYFASDEDVNSRSLLAIRATQVCFVQPITTLATIVR